MWLLTMSFPNVDAGPDVAAGPGVPVSVNASFIDPSFIDSFDATIDWGDGTTSTGAISLTPGSPGVPATGVVTGSHQYSDSGPYTVTVSVGDGSGDFGSDSFTVTNALPEISIDQVAIVEDEGNGVTLNADFSDLGFDFGGTTKAFTAEINWGDGTISTGNVTVTPGDVSNPTTGTITAAHAYGSFGNYSVEVKLIDENGGEGIATIDATIGNLPPVLASLPVGGFGLNQPFVLTGEFTDPGFTNTHAINIDWGDGTVSYINANEIIDLNDPPIYSFSEATDTTPGQFSIEHVYTTIDDYTVVVTAIDNGGLASTQQRVYSATPELTGVIAPLQPLEGIPFRGPVATFTAPGRTPNFFGATIQWGDGTTTTVFGSDGDIVENADGSYTVNATHTYRDNAVNLPFRVTVADIVNNTEDSGDSLVTVLNVAPTLQLDAVADINENGFATLTGTISDPGTLDSFSLEINWGDPLSPNNTETYTFDASSTATQSFTLTHQYLDDNPTSSASDPYQISVTLTDKDSGADDDEETVVVHNVAPVINTSFATSLSDNLLINGDFEQSPRLWWRGQNHQKYGWFKSHKIPGWTATGSVNTIEIQEGDHGTGVANNDQVAEIDQGRELSQTFTIDQSGEVEFSIDVAKRNSSDTKNGVAVYIDDQLLMTIQPQVNAPVTYTETVNLTAGDHTIKIVSLSQSPHFGSVVDNVLIRQRILVNQDAVDGSFSPDDLFAGDDLSGELVKHTTIARTFNVDTHGRFDFSFDAARTSHKWLKNGFKVLLDGEEFKRIYPDSDDLQSYEFELDLFAGEHTLKFVSLSRSHSHGSLLDNVSLQQTDSLDSMQVDLCVHSDGSVDLDGTFSDIGSLDTHQLTVDWGDGSSEVLYDFTDLDRAFSGNHVYQEGGVYQITLTLIDDDDGIDTTTQMVAVRGTGLVDGTLYIIGTDQRDKIEIYQYHDKIKVREDLHGEHARWLHFPKSEVRSILIGSCDGDDRISVHRPNFVPVKVQADGGNNSISLGDGHEIITTGDGNDTIHFGDGLFTIDAGNGHNHVHGDDGDGTITSGDGNDYIRLDDGDVTINAGDGHNRIYADDGNHIITTGSGNDRIRVDDGEFQIDAGDGDNEICVGDGDGTILTGDGYDELHLHRGNHIINVGHGGSDIEIHGDGDNHITAGDGRDEIRTRNGRQIIITGAGNDYIRTGQGNDFINAGAGNDTIKSGRGNDIVLGGDGDDYLYGERGRDLLIGGIGADRIYGGNDDDLLIDGETIYDGDGIALDAIMAEWTSNRSFQDRVNNLQTGVGLDSDITLIADQTVLSDDDRDHLYGNSGHDHLIGDSIDRTRT